MALSRIVRFYRSQLLPINLIKNGGITKPCARYSERVAAIGSGFELNRWKQDVFSYSELYYLSEIALASLIGRKTS